MAIVDLVMPKMGESIMEATVLKWLKHPGDKVQQDEPLLEIATDKVDTDVPSIADGILEKVFFEENDIVPIGAVIATIRTEVLEPEIVAPITNGEVGATLNKTYPEQPPTKQDISLGSSNTKVNRFYSPLVMNIVSSEGVSMSELEHIPGTGNEGRVTKKDILEFVEHRKNNKSQSSNARMYDSVVVHQSQNESTDNGNQSPAVYSGNVEVVEMDQTYQCARNKLL
jgi:2-oxoglutarate dehydrogenase E2 component (dihydrolipoamide succinyltransferase)